MCAFRENIYCNLARCQKRLTMIKSDGDDQVSKEALTVANPSRQMLLGERVLTWRIGDILYIKE